MRKIKTDLILRCCILAAIIGSISACAKNSPVKLSFASVGNNALYIDIAKAASGKYVVTQISNVSGMIKLNDLSPAFNTGDIACAGGGQFDSFLNIPDCVKLEENFRTMKMNIGAYKTQWYRYSAFDAGAYTKAVNEALSSSQLNREVIIRDYDSYVQTYQTKARSMFELQKKRYNDNWKNTLVVFQVRDDSGFYRDELKSSLINLSSEVKLASGPLPYKDNTSGSETAFRELYASAEKKLAKYEADLNKYADNFTVSLPSVKALFENIGYTASLPATANIRNIDGGQVVPIEVVIESKKISKQISNMYPEFSLSDNTITLSFNGRSLVIHNLSDGFVKVSSISVYYNQIISTTNYDQNKIIQLPPRSKMKDPIGIAQLASSEMQSAANMNMTAEQAKRDKLRFGFAVNYSISGKDKTLFSEKEYSLESILSK